MMTGVSGTVPEGRVFHSTCVLGRIIYIHGGYTQTGRVGRTNDIYKLDTATMVWSLIDARGTLPPPSSCHSATIIGTKMFIYAGRGKYGYNIISVFDTETDSWLDTPSPAAQLPEDRDYHSSFSYNGEFYIFGGRYNNDCESWPCNDMWRFRPETLSWKEVKPKVNDAFWVSHGCCCMVGDRVFIFGGYSHIVGFRYNDDLHILDLNPSLKTLCKLSVIQYDLEQKELPHNMRWELRAMTDGELED